MTTSNPRVVLIHDWLTGMRGGEKCLQALCRRWPHALLRTLLHNPGAVASDIEQLQIQPSILNRLPKVTRYYRYLLPLMPFVVRQWSIPDCDLVVSFSHCVAKSVKPPKGVPHVSYCFTPMRYAWHVMDSYFGEERCRGLKGWAIRQTLKRIREWDRRTSANVSHFIAISRTIQARIWECYGRNSTVIYPPVDTDFYTPIPHPRDDYYLVVSAFAPYKRVDLALEACQRLGRKLVIIGTGQDQERLQSLVKNPDNVQFLGWQSNETIREHFRKCRALLFPGEEDFGIVPVEAMACGAPVIAYGRGGATETVVPLDHGADATGIWFGDQNVDCLIAAMERLEQSFGELSPSSARRRATKFNQNRYQHELFTYLDQVLQPASTKPSIAA